MKHTLSYGYHRHAWVMVMKDERQNIVLSFQCLKNECPYDQARRLYDHAKERGLLASVLVCETYCGAIEPAATLARVRALDQSNILII